MNRKTNKSRFSFSKTIRTGCRIRLINSVRYVVSNRARGCCCQCESSSAWIFWMAFVGAKAGSLKRRKWIYEQNKWASH